MPLKSNRLKKSKIIVLDQVEKNIGQLDVLQNIIIAYDSTTDELKILLRVAPVRIPVDRRVVA